MSVKKLAALAATALLVIGMVGGCDDDTSYDQRTVIYVSNINEGSPYLSDVLNQGDSLYYNKTVILKREDDYIEEDRIKVEFHNRPYNSQQNPTIGSLGDFLVTGYRIEFVRDDGGPTPVEAFEGNMQLLVPANSMVEGIITLVPFYNKAAGTMLAAMQYTALEIMTNAHITFRGHEVQTDRNIEFSCALFVEFADPLCLDE